MPTPRPNLLLIQLLSMATISLLHGSVCYSQDTQQAYMNGTPQKVALLVGIDHYGAYYTPEVALREQWTALQGSVNDTKALGEFLIKDFRFITCTTRPRHARESLRPSRTR